MSSSFSVRETVRASPARRGTGRCPWESHLTQTLPCLAVARPWHTHGGAGPGLVATLQGSLCPGAKGAVCIWGHREAGVARLGGCLSARSCGTGAWPGPGWGAWLLAENSGQLPPHRGLCKLMGTSVLSWTSWSPKVTPLYPHICLWCRTSSPRPEASGLRNLLVSFGHSQGVKVSALGFDCIADLLDRGETPFKEEGGRG